MGSTPCAAIIIPESNYFALYILYKVYRLHQPHHLLPKRAPCTRGVTAGVTPFSFCGRKVTEIYLLPQTFLTFFIFFGKKISFSRLFGHGKRVHAMVEKARKLAYFPHLNTKIHDAHSFFYAMGEKTTAVVFQNHCGRFQKRLQSFSKSMPSVFSTLPAIPFPRAQFGN